MNLFKRKFIKIIGLSFISTFFSVNSLFAAAKKIVNSNLSDQQKNVMFNDATERPFSSNLLNEKRKGFYHCANCGNKLFHQLLNSIVALVGRHSQRLYLALLKLRQIILLKWKEQNTTALNVAHIMDMFLMMALENQVKDSVIMACV